MTSGGSNAASAPTPGASSADKVQLVAAVDVSIPYNAAAVLTYNEWSGGTFDEATFQKFQSIYEEKAVAQVTAKKLNRDYELESERLKCIVAKADAALASLALGKGGSK